jgi:hypothetical protein
MSTARIITLLLLLLFAVAGCSDDDDPATLQGSYTRYYTVDAQDYLVRLTFTANQLLLWEPLEEIPGHTASTVGYAPTADGFRVFDDDQCGDDAEYSCTISADAVVIKALADACAPREAALSGAWDRED